MYGFPINYLPLRYHTIFYYQYVIYSLYIQFFCLEEPLCCVASNAVTPYCNRHPPPCKGNPTNCSHTPPRPARRWSRTGASGSDRREVSGPCRRIPMYFYVEIPWCRWLWRRNHELIVASPLRLRYITSAVVEMEV